ncbi:MAG: hypothetical protein WCA32_11935 [Chromatiaceae bacterium]
MRREECGAIVDLQGITRDVAVETAETVALTGFGSSANPSIAAL